MTRLPDSYRDQTVSHGTLLPEHLMAACLPVLREADADAAAVIEADYAAAGVGEERDGIVYEDLFDTLNSVAPEGTSFSAHPGDGSDFGFWTNEPDDVYPEDEARFTAAL